MADAPQSPGGRQERNPAQGLGRRMGSMPGGNRFWLILLVLLAVNYVIAGQASSGPSRLQVPYSFFRAQVVQGNVAEVTSTGDTIEGDFTRKTAPPKGMDGSPSTHFKTERPAFADDKLIDLLLAKKIIINAHPIDEGQPLWQTLVFGFGPTLLIVGLFVLLARRAQAAAGGGALGGFGRSRAKRYDAAQTKGQVDFDDVAGIDEAEDELVEVVDFLRNPERYTKLGASVPRGVLLSGPPGTGKTLLARAVAGEAGVPFFSLSASEFIEAIVGVGASRVRDLFSQAKAAAPAIIFIDELDAIGRARGGGATLGGHDEREQTLNQILTEMDGFTGSEGVIVIAATNRPDVLDHALLRPGRFDRRVTVNPPDQTGRKLILDVHTRDVPLADDVDLQAIAASTPGMVGADLRNLVNEAALTAARRGHERVQLADFTDSLEKIVLGAERRIVLSQAERERTAYHESGHALLGMLQPGADPVRKISIIPRGRALGVTFQSPENDRYGYSADYLRGRLIGSLGGRAAELLIYGDMTTGAESDLEQATRIARMMAGRWGMSEAVGPVSVLPGPNDEPTLFPGVAQPSERTRELVDGEARRILEECADAALVELREHREQLEALTRALLEHETLDEADAYRIAGIDRVPRATARA
ncbi:MAG TPA: ATP-dependent zinc metalloprotease FtsH [Gaiellales bacterium]|nr:ATP-dependent zinc metalloprotease FtsH [Gaiellales bacterium]